TLKINVVKGNQRKEVRALFDNGSQKYYILKKTAVKFVHRPYAQSEILHEYFGGGRELKKHGLYTINIENLAGDFGVILHVMDHEKICNIIPRMSKGAWMNKLKSRNI